MSETQTLEALRKQRDKLKKDLKDVERELEIVKASVKNSTQDKIIKNLTDQNEFPKRMKAMMEKEAKKRKLMDTSNDSESTLLKRYKYISRIKTKKCTVEIQPKEEPEPKNYLYKVKASIQGLKVVLTYLSNKSPTENKDGEIKKELKIVLEYDTLQKEIQEGLDYFYNHAENIQQAILFLKCVYKLAVIRHKMLKSISKVFGKHLAIENSDNTGRFILKYKGIKHTEYIFALLWQIKFHSATNLAMDAFELYICPHVPDDIRRRIKKSVLSLVSDYETSTVKNYKLKYDLLYMILSNFVKADADAIDSSTDSSSE